jgi:hypothetical protein
MHKNLRQNQQGIATVLLVALILVVLAAAGFVGYRVMNKDKKSSGSSAAATAKSKEVADACDDVITDKNICKFASAFYGEDAYEVTITSAGGDQGDGTVVTKVDGDNTQTTITSNGAVFADYITLDGKTYVKDISSGEWTVSADENFKAEDIKDDLDIDFEADKAAEDRTQYKLIGK